MSTLEEMKSVDVRTVDRDRLVDINEIRIDDSLSPKERTAEFLKQIWIYTEIMSTYANTPKECPVRRQGDLP